ncbi:hypothetical protein AB990_07735 [Alkalihalobacillus pseudalcaliphilus]|nr:hypothetical protein AB990_07735 [Alkalihalobacillus pseudalcaliphilus]
MKIGHSGKSILTSYAKTIVCYEKMDYDMVDKITKQAISKTNICIEEGGVKMNNRIIDNRGEAHEWLLIIVALCSLVTFKKISKLEKYKEKLKGQFKPY